MEMLIYSAILILSTFISSLSQILLKKGAQKTYSSKIREYLNPYVIAGYALFFGCTLISMVALRVIPLSTSQILETSGYIFVAVLSFIFLKEKITLKQLIGTAVIVLGVVVYSL